MVGTGREMKILKKEGEVATCPLPFIGLFIR